MAYNADQMRLMGGVPGQQLFLYRTDDTPSDAQTPGYFDPAVDHYSLSGGDIVFCVSDAAGTPALNALVADLSGEGCVMRALG